jgi:hypothetical protein
VLVNSRFGAFAQVVRSPGLSLARRKSEQLAGHGWTKPSDESLKQAIITVERALVALRGVGTASP